MYMGKHIYKPMNYNYMNYKPRHRRGIALISVLFIAAVVLILASTFIFTIVRERQSTTAARLMNDALQVADAVSERGRMQVVGSFKDTFAQAPEFVREVSAIIYSEPTLSKDSVLKGKITAANLMTTNAIVIDGKTGWWRVTGATPFNKTTGKQIGPSLYLEVSATAQTANGVQTVIRRINMGQSHIFDLALLSKNTNCIYCHLRVNGDVGSLGAYLQPGWESSTGFASGGDLGGSVVNGTAYLQGLAGVRDASGNQLDADTNLTANPNEINGAKFTKIEQNYTGEPLPQKDGANAFPAISRDIGQQARNGTVSGGTIYAVDIGSTLSALPSSSNVPVVKGNEQKNKNIVLIGTEANPIVLSGDVYFEGDVVIKGVVKGRGAIYSGRNVYVAGNVQYSNPPDNCTQKPDPNGCAQAAIKSGKDELRLGARGNIVLGDYTEVDKSGDPKLWQGLQAANYYRSQFGFTDSTRQKCYDKATGDELEVITTTDPVTTITTTSYSNIEGDEIASSASDPKLVCVAEKGAVNQDAYSYSMRPGKIDENTGEFKSWLSDGLYQDILGQETRKYDSWRYGVNKAALTKADVQKQFGKYNLSDTSTDAILNLVKTGNGAIDISDANNDVMGRVNWDGGLLWVTIDDAFNYEKQTTKVDAFLYANQRVAGKTFGAPLAINGGMIGQEIGVLAPGITKLWYWGDADRYKFIGDPQDPTAPRPDCTKESFVANFVNTTNPSSAEIKTSGVYQPDSMDCALTINYDYRLRNGGLGYNLVAAEVGRTLTWQLADKKNQQVNP
jgi:hypothetical protein